MGQLYAPVSAVRGISVFQAIFLPHWKPSNSSLAVLASQGQALHSVLTLHTVFMAQLEKKHLLLVDAPLKRKDAFASKDASKGCIWKNKPKGAWL